MAMEADVRRRTREQVLAQLRTAPPAATVLPPEEALRALLDRCEPRIDGYGGDFRRDAARYLRLVLEWGEDFHDQPWARPVFDDAEIPGTSKLDVLAVHAAVHRPATTR